MAKMANGLANDLASTALQATDKNVLMAPAMNVRMWQSPATRRNFELLSRDGVLFVGPDEGEMACGEFGPGRMAEPVAIVAAIEAALGDCPLKGVKALVTAGPTREALDPVRYLANHSSGKQGYAIARALAAAGAETVLVSGPVSLAPPPGVTLKKVTTALEMLAACETSLPADVLVMAAAVSDWRPDGVANSKLKKWAAPSSQSSVVPLIRLVENPDILTTLAAHRQRPRLVIGFAAETDDVVQNAVAKRARKGADWIIANDVSGDVMGAEKNRIHLVDEAGVDDWPEMSKSEVGVRLAARIAQKLKGQAA
jgi:phosphopantothenoylcysteine decarboxylase/phosphopantothenate--cysteine ligase